MSESKYKIGDRVRVKSFKEIEAMSIPPDAWSNGLFQNKTGVSFQPEMKQDAGLICTVERISDKDPNRYYLNQWWYPLEWLEDHIVSIKVDDDLFTI